ncbi:hypothetical protein SprV_0200601000 [Sparganum proliferum]
MAELRGRGEGRGADGVNCVAGRGSGGDGGRCGVDGASGDDCLTANPRDRFDGIGGGDSLREVGAGGSGYSRRGWNVQSATDECVDDMLKHASDASLSTSHAQSSLPIWVGVLQLGLALPPRVHKSSSLDIDVQLTIASAFVAPDLSSSRREAANLHLIVVDAVLVVHWEVSDLKLIS